MIKFTIFLFNLCLSCHLFSYIYWFLLVHSYLRNNFLVNKDFLCFYVSFSFILSLEWIYAWLPSVRYSRTERWVTWLWMSERKHSDYFPLCGKNVRRAYICDANIYTKHFPKWFIPLLRRSSLHIWLRNKSMVAGTRWGGLKATTYSLVPQTYVLSLLWISLELYYI